MHFILNMYKPRNSKISSTCAQPWDPSLALLGHFADRNGRFPTLSTRGLFSSAADASMSAGEKKLLVRSRMPFTFPVELWAFLLDYIWTNQIKRLQLWSYGLTREVSNYKQTIP